MNLPSGLPVFPGTVSASGQPATLGVMGGGQLGRMFVHAAQRLGYFTAVLDPDAQSPAGLVSHHHIQTGYDDEQGLKQLAALCAAITTEFENVPAGALQALAASRPVAPGAAAVAIAQNRIEEKSHFTASAAESGALAGVSCAPYAVIETETQLRAVPVDLLPGILKTARMGYDGKGQVRVKNAAELAAAWAGLKQAPCVLEKMLPLKAECSVIVARGWDGRIVSFAPQGNVHVDGILAVTQAYEGNMPAALAQRALAATHTIAHHVGYVGVLCVEFFLVDDGSADGALVVNEMAQMHPMQLRTLDDQRIPRRLINSRMKSYIGIDHRLHVLALRYQPPAHDQRAIDHRAALSGKLRRQRIQRAAHLVQMTRPLDIERRDQHAAPRRILHQPVLLQQTQRLQHR